MVKKNYNYKELGMYYKFKMFKLFELFFNEKYLKL